MTPRPDRASRTAGSAVTEELPRGVDPLSLACDPRADSALALSVRGWWVVLGEPVGVLTSVTELTEVARHCAWRAPRPHGSAPPPFLGGAAGYLADEAAPQLLDLPADERPAMASLPPVWFGVYDTAVCVPPGGGSTWLVAVDLPGWSHRPARRRLVDLRSWVADADTRSSAPTARDAPPANVGPPRWSLSEQGHAAAVRQAKEWIAAGDCYQLNLTVQCAVDWRAPGAALTRRLWGASPDAAHAAYMRLPSGAEVASVSPETFLRTDGDRVRVRPIKGTRPRRVDPAADSGQARALCCSDKDRAEHVMIVDLERNDLGRVCEPGTVTVSDLLALEAHPTVWHLTSTVEGQLRGDVAVADLLAATFPCGSVTGAPKRRAIERIRTLEPVRRGVYCGAIGVVSAGLADFSVGIRTAVVADGIASYGTGGGIVADSHPAAEWAEARDKATAFLRATGVAG